LSGVGYSYSVHLTLFRTLYRWSTPVHHRAIQLTHRVTLNSSTTSTKNSTGTSFYKFCDSLHVIYFEVKLIFNSFVFSCLPHLLLLKVFKYFPSRCADVQIRNWLAAQHTVFLAWFLVKEVIITLSILLFIYKTF